MRNSEAIKTLFIVPSLHRAGAEIQLVDLVNGLSNQHFKKYLFTFERNLDQKNRLDTDQVEFFTLPRRSKFDIAPVKRISELIDLHQIDVIHCTMRFPLLLAALGRIRAKRKPQILTALHSTYSYSVKQELQNRLLYRYLLQYSSNGIIFVCHNQRNLWLSKYPGLKDHSSVIFNGIDPMDFSRKDWKEDGVNLKEQLKIPQSAQVVSCVASFRPVKGHSFLIDAFASLPDTAYLILAGEGQTRPIIEQAVQRLGLGERIKFLGNIDNIRPLLAMSDLTVLPSTAETFSMAMLEAMSMEVPVLATDVGGTSEAVVPYETGILVNPGSVSDLEKGLSEALMTPEKLVAMGKAGRRMVLANFTKDKMIAETASYLKSHTNLPGS